MNRDRDRILEQALKHQLAGEPPPPTPQCLDAETLAAWEEGGLGPAAMEMAEVHLSDCARCQSVLAVMVQGTRPVAAVESSPGFRWRSWWLAPLAAATAAVTIWMVVPEQQPLATTASVAREAETAKPDSTTLQPAQGQEAAAESRDALRDRTEPAPAAPFSEREDRREQQAVAANQAPPVAKEEAGKLAAKEKPDAAADAVAAETAAAPAATIQERAAPLAAAAPVAAPPPSAPPAAPALGALQKSARAANAPVEVVAPDTLRRWRVVPTGVEYSVDRGISWVPIRAVGTETLTGGIAPSGSICWLIGRAGVVLVTVDGMTFAKVDLPVRSDVLSIEAKDARSATVTVADGRTFHTDDSGRNWRRN